MRLWLIVSKKVFFAGLLWLFTVSPRDALCQTQVFVSHEGERELVIGMDGEYPIIQGESGRERIFSTKMSMQRADRFTDGGIKIVNKDAVMGQDYGSVQGSFFFRFRIEVEADRDFEDCFILVAIAPEEGSETVLMREIKDIEAGGVDVIDIIVPVNPGFGGGGYGYHIYSQGEEIQVDDPLAKAVVRQQQNAPETNSESRPRPRPRDPPQRAFPAKALKTSMPDFPQSLEGTNASGLAQVTFAIGESGQVVEILAMTADYSDFLVEARKSILESSYQPATYEGEPLFTTVTQVFTFNEFVSFSEELEMIPYPSLQNSEPRLLHSPLVARLRRGEDFGAQGKVVLEAVIDKFGRIQQPRVVEAAPQLLVEATLESLPEWVFLPAIREGQAIERRIQIPVTF